MFKSIFIFLFSLNLCIHSNCQTHSVYCKDSIFHNYGVSFHFPKDTNWEIGIIELDGSNSGDTSFIKELDHTKITIFPEKGDIHACITIKKNESRLYNWFYQYNQRIISESYGLTVLDTSIIVHKGMQAFEIIWRWKELGSPIYSFQRTWYIIDKNQFITRVSYEGDEKTYFKYFKTAMRIMKSVELE